MRLLPFIVSAVMIAPIITAQQKTPAPEAEQMVYAIYVIRHGVRSPTGDAAQYQRFSSAAWPNWPVPPGYLTTHGYEAIKALGRYDREELASRALIASDGCSDVDYVTIHADSDERTRETAKALAEGMFPGCKVAIRALEENANDALFHLPNASVSRKEATVAADAVLNRIGNDPKSVATAHRGQLADLDRVLANCGTSTPMNSRVSIFDVPASVVPGNDDHLVTMKGPVNIAGTLVENMLLEYAEGMPKRDVGWGCVDETKLRQLINLHTEASDLTQRTPEVAVLQAAALLRTIDRSIAQAATGRLISGAEGKPGDKVLVLVGHDTNLNNLAGALRLHWMLDGRKDDTPPGSGLVFELWKNRKLKTYTVRVSYMTQTLEQMRNVIPLTSRHPPQRVPVFLPVCSRANIGCDISSFERVLEDVSRNAAKSDLQESPHTTAIVPGRFWDQGWSVLDHLSPNISNSAEPPHGVRFCPAETASSHRARSAGCTVNSRAVRRRRSINSDNEQRNGGASHQGCTRPAEPFHQGRVHPVAHDLLVAREQNDNYN